MARSTPPAVKAARLAYHDAKWAWFDASDRAYLRALDLGIEGVEAMNAHLAADPTCAELHRRMELAKADFVAARKASKVPGL